MDKGWGIEQPTDEVAKRKVAVIASPGRVADPELANAWVFPTVDDTSGAP